MSGPRSLCWAADWARRRGRSPIVTLTTLGSWTIGMWREGSAGPACPDLAALELVELNGAARVRLVVADPAENALLPDAATRSGRAVAAVWQSARRGGAPAAALRQASAAVCDPALRPRQRNPLATACIADLHLTEPLVTGASRGGDCEVWVGEDGRLTKALSLEMWTAQGRSRWNSERAKVGPGPERWRAQEIAVDDPSYWHHHVIGLVPDPVLDTLPAPLAATDVVVTSDGARLGSCEAAVSIEGLSSWLGQRITDVGPDWPHSRAHGDLGLIWARHSSGHD